MADGKLDEVLHPIKAIVGYTTDVVVTKMQPLKPKEFAYG